MKIIYSISLVFSLLFICSCSDNRVKDEPAVIQHQTPEVLDDSKADLSSVSKRYSSDIVQDLFNEAVSKNSELQKLTNRINTIGEIKADSLKPYSVYLQNNDMYWSSANRYISQISDSVLKNDLKEIFKNMEINYKAAISKHSFLMEKLEGKEKMLNDYEILMKLSVTIPMISSYQKNELPAINTLNSLVGIYDTLINDTRSYSTIIK
jgi:hypothetical protein